MLREGFCLVPKLGFELKRAGLMDACAEILPISCVQACKFVEENLALQTSKLGKDVLMNCARTAMSSKIIGSDSDFYGKLAVDAVLSVKQTGQMIPVTCPCTMRICSA